MKNNLDQVSFALLSQSWSIDDIKPCACGCYCWCGCCGNQI